MAEVAEEIDSGTDDGSLASAAAAFTAMLDQEDGQIAAPASQAQPIQPQAEAEAPLEAEASTGEVAQAPAVEAATTQPEPAKVPAPSSTELDTRVQAATKAEQEANQARDRYLAQTNLLVQNHTASFTAAFPDVKTREDLLALANPQSPTYNVDRYNAAAFAIMQFQEAQGKQQAAQADVEKARHSQLEKFQAEEFKKLPDLIPELKDPKKAPVHAKALQEYAFQNGYTPEQLRFASARDFQLLNKAMMQDRHVAQAAAVEKQNAATLAEANRKAAKAPPVQTPGTVRATNGNVEKLEDAAKRLEQSGRLDDAAAYFNQMFKTG